MGDLVKGLVSIVVPIYNQEDKIHRFLDSILRQTYKKLELILVNDGSTDNTVDVVRKYEHLFLNKGIFYKYISHEDLGLAAAVNSGLKVFTGEYLCWPDPDDFLADDSIEKKKTFLDLHQEYDIVRTDAYVYECTDLKNPVYLISGGHKNKNRFEENVFDNYILEKNIWLTPGCFMLRGKAFLKVYPNRHIWESRYGQDYQLILPFIYKKKMGYIDEPLFSYVKYKVSLTSAWTDTYQKAMKVQNEHQEIILETLKRIPLSKKEVIYYQKMVKIKYLERKFKFALLGQKKDFALEYFRALEEIGGYSWKIRLCGRILNMPWGLKFCNWVIDCKRKWC